jgi:hypothetical protein
MVMEGEVLTFYRLGGLTCNGREGGSSMLGAWGVQRSFGLMAMSGLDGLDQLTTWTLRHHHMWLGMGTMRADADGGKDGVRY